MYVAVLGTLCPGRYRMNGQTMNAPTQAGVSRVSISIGFRNTASPPLLAGQWPSAVVSIASRI